MSHTGARAATATTTSAGLRILMTADAVGGVWTYALDLAAGLGRLGHHTTLAVLGPPLGADQRVAATRASGLDLVETGLPLDWTAASPDIVLRSADAVAALGREIDADIVHLNSPALAAEACFPAPVVAACHSCVKTWWEAVRGTALPVDFTWRADLVARGYARAAILVAPTRAFADATASAYGLRHRPTVVPNGRVSAPSHHASESADLVFTAGRLWDEGKNIALLDQAAAGLRWPVFAAGPQDGPNGARITLRHVQPLGRLTSDEMTERLSGRPIFVSPALYEPFGLAVLEAAQYGCALVLSGIPSFREMWEGAAIFVDPHDASALMAALESLASDPPLRLRIGQAAAARARGYTADAMVAETLQVYRRVLEGAPTQVAPGGLRSAIA